MFLLSSDTSQTTLVETPANKIYLDPKQAVTKSVTAVLSLPGDRFLQNFSM